MIEHSPKLPDELRSRAQVRDQFLEKSRDATLRALRWTSRGNFELSRYWWRVSENYEHWANTLAEEMPMVTCSRCGEQMEAGLEPDGCRDPDCPRQ